MDARFKNRTAKVLIVEPTGTKRQVFADIIKSLGFSNIGGFKTGREVLDYLETEHADWIIMPLFAAQDVNALQILKIIVETPRLFDVRVSILLEPLEQWCLSPAYNLGLMSHHVYANVKETLLQEFRGLLASGEKHHWNTTLVAADYYRRHLLAGKDYKNLLRLEEALLETLPGESSTLLHMAEAQFLMKEPARAMRTLKQLALMDPNMAAAAESLRRKVVTDPNFMQEMDPETIREIQNGDDNQAGVNAFGINDAVVVDGDSTVLFFMQKILTEAGVPNIHCFERAEPALQWLEKHGEPGLIIQEWRLPDVSGPFFLQRVRHMGHLRVPILVMSSLIKPQEMPLLKEMSVSGVMPKPFDHQAFYGTLIWALQQDRLPTEQRTMERKIKQMLDKGQFGEAERLKAEYLRLPGVALAATRQMEAEVAYRFSQYQAAITYAAEALKAGGDTLLLLDLLGKSFLKLGNYSAALKAFEKAQALSPLNIGRLCLAALAESEVGGSQKAQEWLQRAKQLDARSTDIAETDVSLSLIAGDLEKARALMEELSSLSRILGYMNNRAVAMAINGKPNLGIVTYRDILASLPQKHDGMQSIVTYNLALAFIRQNKLQEAADYLAKIDKIHTPALERKITSLRKRLGRALKKGERIKVNLLDASSSSQVSPATIGRMKAAQEVMTILDIPKGKICCFRLLGVADGGDPRARKLLEQMPRFKVRESIEKPDFAKDTVKAV